MLLLIVDEFAKRFTSILIITFIDLHCVSEAPQFER